MTLWDMLDKTKYYQKVWIFETNAYDQNMPIFKGTVDEARRDADMVWDYLMDKVETYDCSDCPLLRWCNITDEEGVAATVPEDWPDPEEGGGEG